MSSPSPETTTEPRRRIHPSIKIIFVLLVLVSVGVFVRRSVRQTATPEPRFTWLTPAQFSPPDKVQMLYYKILNLTAPGWRHFSRPKTHIQISFKILSARNGANEQFAIGLPFATNQNAVRAWILGPDDLTALQQRVRNASDIQLISSPKMLTADGTGASMAVAESIPSTDSSIPAVTAGIMLSLMPKISGQDIRLMVNALCSEFTSRTPPVSTRTNLSAACQVRVPNGGAIVIANPVSKIPNGTNYWLIVSPGAVDGFGKPIKL